MKNKNDENRIEFSRDVPDILFRKAGGRCSVPRCKNPTMGPFSSSDGAVNMGVACHIYSAAKNGPRGWGDKKPDFIRSEENGIWCCHTHAALIDKNKGKDYSADTLFSWKELAEARVKKQMNDIPSPLGWVETISVTDFPLPQIRPTITLSRWNLLYGKQCVGKTTLLEFAASISNSKYAERFLGNENRLFEATLNHSTVDDYDKKINLEILNKEFKRIENGQSCLLSPGDLEIIYCDDSDLRPLIHEDHIDLMQRVLNVDKAALMSLCEIGTKTLMSGEIKFEQATEYVEDQDSHEDDYISRPKLKLDGSPFYELQFKSKAWKRNEFVSYERLATSEKAKLVLDLQITKGRETAKQRLTLLIVEGLAKNFDEDNFQNLLEALRREHFQAIVSIPPYLESIILDKKENEQHDYLTNWCLKAVG